MRWVVLIGFIGVVGARAPAQAPAKAPAQTPAKARNAVAALDCRTCHTAGTPTKTNPALLACPRLLVTGYHAVADAPKTIALGTPGTYGAVRFSHGKHAQMAATGQGCNGCHHYDQARPIQECKSCHSTSRLRADLGKPDVQAAMHRQCLECHRDWNPAATCSSCHVQAGAIAVSGVAGGTAQPAAKAPKLTAPVRIVYETKAVEGKTVTFLHDDHTRRFGLQCADCHQRQSCASCHASTVLARTAATAATRLAAKSGAVPATHARCSTCHATAQCATCHTNSAARTAGFDHRTRTGWALNRLHAPLACQRCHTTPGKFEKLNPDCESCHKGWQAKFEHAKTGLALDQVHVDAGCVSCHEDKAFVAAPSCAGCHTDKAYPADKPGKRVPRPALTPAPKPATRK
jgi:hypothetical protein